MDALPASLSWSFPCRCWPPDRRVQLTEQKLADMTLEYGKGFLLAPHLGRAKDATGLRPEEVILGELNNAT